jgi:hypothetical protein
VLVSEAAGSRDHKTDRVELVPVQRFIFLQVLIEGQAVEPSSAICASASSSAIGVPVSNR